MLVSIWDFSHPFPPIINTVDRWQAGLLVSHNQGEYLHQSDVYKSGGALTWQFASGVGDNGGVFSGYGKAIAFFSPIVNDMLTDLIAYLNAQIQASSAGGDLTVQTLRQGLFAAGRATVWGLGGLAAGLATGTTGGLALAFLFLVGFDSSLGSDVVTIVENSGGQNSSDSGGGGNADGGVPGGIGPGGAPDTPPPKKDKDEGGN
jgi:hypothetical protein